MANHENNENSFAVPDFSRMLEIMSREELASMAADCLSRLDPGIQPLELFKELSRLVTISTFEVTPFRTSKKGVTEVLLAQRPETDPWWPSKWHLPGSIILPAEEMGIRDYESACDRILSKEFEGNVERTQSLTIFDAQLRTDVRGSEQTVFGWTDVELTSASAKLVGAGFFKVDKIVGGSLGENVLSSHVQTVRNAMANRNREK